MVRLTRGNPFSPQAVGQPLSSAQRNKSPLVELLPHFTTRRAWFTEIGTDSALTVAAGQSAWYGLRRLSRANLGEDVGLFGVRFELLPANVDGTVAASAGTSALWGDLRGNGAAIIVGRNLPVALNAWTQAPCYAAGVEFAVASAAGLLVNNQEAQYVVTRRFPPGKLADTTPQRHTDPVSFAPWVLPIGETESLDVALVVNRSQYNTAKATSLVIVGMAEITLYLGRTYARTGAH